MHKVLTRLLSAMFTVASLSISAHAGDLPAFTPIPVGYISYDVTGADVAQFDIVQLHRRKRIRLPGHDLSHLYPSVADQSQPDGQLSRRSITRLGPLILHPGL